MIRMSLRVYENILRTSRHDGSLADIEADTSFDSDRSLYGTPWLSGSRAHG